MPHSYRRNEIKRRSCYRSLVPEDELNEDNIMPEAFDPRVADVVSAAVKAHIAD